MTSGPKEFRDPSRLAPDDRPELAASGERPRWTRPEFVCHGDLRELTMGLSVPPGESGFETTRHGA